MTNTTLNTTALLVAAVDALTAQISAAKKAGVEVPGIGTEVSPGVKLRDLKNWRKEFAAKQADASKPAAASVKPAAAKAAAAPKATAAPKAAAPVAEELKSGAIREAGVVMIGRAKENVLRISKINDVRTVVTDKGSKIAVADLEFNNRGALRVKLDMVEKYTAPAETSAPVKAAAAPKATGKKPAAVEQEDLPEETPAAAGGRVFPIRVLNIKTSTQLTGAEYDRNTKTLFVTLKDAAVWAYEGVALSEVRAFEQSPQPWKHFSSHIAHDKKGKMVKNHKMAASQAAHAASEKAPVKTVAVKPAAKTAAPKAAAPAAEISTTALRAEGFMDGRKHETVQSIVRVKETQERVVVTTSGKRVPLLSIVLVKGKFRVADLHEVPSKAGKTAASAPAAKPAENTRKTVNGKAAKLNFEKAEKAPKAAKQVVSEKPTRDQVKTVGVRVIKGSKEKMVNVIRIVTRDDQLVAVTENKGALPYSLIMSFDGQPTFTGKITADEFRAL
jgi:histone H1/5